MSGLAEGVDAAAHTAALDFGGETFAVIGTPLDKYYPAENEEAQSSSCSRTTRDQSVSDRSAATTPKSFPIRNRTMALLSDATVIVEAGEKSGTLHQGWEALRLGRLLFLMESVATDPALSWPREMIKYGAQVLTRENLSEELADLPSLASRKTDAGVQTHLIRACVRYAAAYAYSPRNPNLKSRSTPVKSVT